MRKFIIKSLLFMAPLLLLFAWWEHGLARIPNSYNTKAALIEKALADCEVLVLGSSHAYKGINPAYFQEKGFNMANNSQTLYYDYEITARYLPRMPKLKCVLYMVSYFSLECAPLSRSPEAFRSPFYRKYFHFPCERWEDNFDIRNFSMIALYGMPESIHDLRLRFKVNLAEHIESNGWYEVTLEKGQEKQPITDETGRIKAEIHNQKFMSESNIDYNRTALLKAINLCKDAHVIPVIITTPVFHTYRDHMEAEKYARMQSVIHDLCETTGTKYFNYLDDRRFDINDFSDDDHLSASGAEKFSKILDREVLQLIR